MTSLQTFYKVKDLQEREKKQKQKIYQEHIDHFESVATQMYELLKRKETEDLRFDEELSGSSIKAEVFMQHERFVEQLEQQINDLQNTVHKARTDMESAHEVLSTAHIEVKKYESLIDRRLQQRSAWNKAEESKSMDELSVRQFLNYKNR
ncbi:flagellar export protein FliJ [Halobacillus sp. A5]|uniref:flagellar export protein FliJ n=1 Tax=Halobacillus sp. A5 TaxID=2880263 RepID=UPI0020A62585|nr:flagellar export protein FliJ [Halobacillus sp. A5]MCP3026121.1 flagellar export protein FliJ [Halobacillus sp. A5]